MEQDKFKLKLDEERTTNRNDYKVPILQPLERFNQYSCKGPHHERVYKHRRYEPKDVHTMRPWNNPENNIPFDTLWTRKPIIREHPWIVMERTMIEKPPLDYDIIKNRPRRYMTPAIGVDDIDDPQIRDLIIKDTYISEKQHGELEMKFKPMEKEILESTREKLVDPIRENYSVVKPLPKGWKGKGKKWETKQYIQLVDPDKAYWQNYKNILNTKVGISPFEHYVSDETKKEIRALIEKDELRMAYDLMKPCYDGHRPRNAAGPLRKQELIAKDRL